MDAVSAVPRRIDAANRGSSRLGSTGPQVLNSGNGHGQRRGCRAGAEPLEDEEEVWAAGLGNRVGHRRPRRSALGGVGGGWEVAAGAPE